MITRRDVAEHAGVSKTTVSRVLNNNGYVSPENRERVEESIRLLGYRPNLIARSLKTKQTKQLLFYAPELTNPFYIEVYHGMEDYAEEQGYTIVVSSRYDHRVIEQRQFDGIILSNVSPEQQKEYSDLDIPTVVTNYSSHALSIPYAGIDIEEGALNAMKHLAGCGHKRIAFISNVPSDDDQRLQGYKKSLESANLAYDPRMMVVDAGKGTAYHQGYRAAERLIQARTGATAVFSFNDAMAIGALSAFSERGIDVPDDISVMGFDDILQSGFTDPPLSTVRMPKYQLGRESARMLIEMINGKKVQPVVLKTGLLIRKSTTNIFIK